jgi:hypothetical protein
MNTKLFEHNNNRQGFTLVEVLVSSFLTLVIMGMLFRVLMGTMDAYDGGTSKLKSSGDARFALDILKTDLESMSARQTTFDQMWLASHPADPGNNDYNTELTFFAPSLDRDSEQVGDIVALRYEAIYQDPISETDIKPIYGLYKTIPSTDTESETEVAFNYALGQSDILTDFWNDIDPDRGGFLAPNVVRFRVAWWIRHSTGGPPERIERFDATHFVSLNNVLRVWDEGGTLIIEGGRIESAEVALTTITDEGMRQYAFFRDQGPGGDLSDRLNRIINDFGQSHTMRLPIYY